MPSEPHTPSEQQIQRDLAEVALWMDQNEVKRLQPGYAMSSVDAYKGNNEVKKQIRLRYSH